MTFKGRAIILPELDFTRLHIYLLCHFIGLASLGSSESERGACLTQPKAKSTPGSLDTALGKGTYLIGLEYFSLSPAYKHSR